MTEAQWQCAYCETSNLMSSTTCLVCERPRPDDASIVTPRATGPAGGGRPPTNEPRAVLPPLSPPTPASTPMVPPATGYGAPLGPSSPQPSVTYVMAQPAKTTRWWVVPAYVLAVGLLVVIGVAIGLWLSGT